MHRYRRTAAATVATLAAFIAQPIGAHAAGVSTTFAGTITSTMSVNNGTNVGSIGAGTPYTGTLAYDDVATTTPVAYGGGTRTTYGFTDLTFQIGTSTAHSGPGRIDVFDNLTNATGYPNGDSVYVNFGGVAPSGLLAGAAFNWMGLALLDPSGAAVVDGRLPALNSALFPTRFSEFNYGTRGTPWGAGNTSTIQSLTTVTTGTQPPPPPPAPLAFSAVLPDGTAGLPYSAEFPAATGGTGSYSYRAAGLPAGLTVSGRTVSGVPATVGSYPVTLTAVDNGTGESVSSTATVAIADQALAFAPSLPGGVVGVPYSAVLAASGFGPFTYTASGLPNGLALSGDNVTGTPTTAGTSTVTLTATDAAGTTVTTQVPLTVAPAAPAGNYTVKDEGKGRITAVAPDYSYLVVGSRTLIWTPDTLITVNTPAGERHTIDSFVTAGMRVQWK
ncbi:MAG TPA: putative Ig domain-containing protein, partial [Sporichthya sp.]|nr:putative Ig domain-containing protein [Sporichthya sp.]